MVININNNSKSWVVEDLKRQKRKSLFEVIYLFVSLENSSKGGDLLSFGAEERLELENLLQEALGVPLGLFAAAQARVRHGAPLTAQVHGHLKRDS